MYDNFPIITILGPTATGKTTLATKLASIIEAEIISADSRQVYRRMDLGTGKDLSDYIIDSQPIKYHLIDIHEPGYKYNVFEYQQDFLSAYRLIQKNKKPAILCGGTGMYIEAVLNGYKMTSVPINEPLRAQLELLDDKQLVDRLNSLKTVHNNSDFDTRKRTIRAIEIAEYQINNKEKVVDFPKLESVIFGISMERNDVCDSIYKRLKERLRLGMIDEVEDLLKSGLSPADLEYYGLEYKFITQFLQKQFSYNYMVEHLNIAIRQFAKRQMTWFRRMERNGFKINWIDAKLPMRDKLEYIFSVLNEYKK